jgi:hypothetical protein
VKIIMIDVGIPLREKLCEFCKRVMRLYPVKLDDGAWTSGCEDCAKSDRAKVMP